MNRPALLVAPALLLLSACGGGDEIIFDTTLGPETERQIEALPQTLEGDKGNARYSTENLRGAGMESDDGSGQ